MDIYQERHEFLGHGTLPWSGCIQIDCLEVMWKHAATGTYDDLLVRIEQLESSLDNSLVNEDELREQQDEYLERIEKLENHIEEAVNFLRDGP